MAFRGRLGGWQAAVIFVLAGSLELYALNFPEVNLPDPGPIPPCVITAAGRRLLLDYVRDMVEVKVGPNDTITVAPRGWWLINYPLDSIAGMQGRSDDEISQALFGKLRSEVKNYYFYSAGTPPAEPPEPTGPAPFVLSVKADITLSPGQSIGDAANSASPGTVIQVSPGAYAGGFDISSSGTSAQPIVIEGIRDAQGTMPVIEGQAEMVHITGDFIHFRGIEFHGGGQAQQHPQMRVTGSQGTLVEGCTFVNSDAVGLMVEAAADLDLTSARTIVRGNWVLNPVQVGIKTETDPSYDQISEEGQNGVAPGHQRLVVEFNHVTGCKGVGGFWESGGMKVFMQVGCVFRYNTIVHNTSLGFWMDWEHFNNRIEGNYFEDNQMFAAGAEASPGPNLFCNNVVVEIHPGPPFYQVGLLSWDSNRSWSVGNTVDNRGTGAKGINMSGNQSQRQIHWPTWENASHVYVNNVILGSSVATESREGRDTCSGNFTEGGGDGPGVMHVDTAGAFVDAGAGDYRLRTQHGLAASGVTNEFSGYLTHDFYGLLRFPEDSIFAGALRPWPTDIAGTLVEVEYDDGTMRRHSATRLEARLRDGGRGARPFEVRVARPGTIVVEHGGGADVQVAVFTSRGRALSLNVACGPGRSTIDARRLAPGAYLVRVTGGSGSVSAGMVLR